MFKQLKTSFTKLHMIFKILVALIIINGTYLFQKYICEFSSDASVLNDNEAKMSRNMSECLFVYNGQKNLCA